MRPAPPRCRRGRGCGCPLRKRGERGAVGRCEAAARLPPTHAVGRRAPGSLRSRRTLRLPFSLRTKAGEEQLRREPPGLLGDARADGVERRRHALYLLVNDANVDGAIYAAAEKRGGSVRGEAGGRAREGGKGDRGRRQNKRPCPLRLLRPAHNQEAAAGRMRRRAGAKGLHPEGRTREAEEEKEKEGRKKKATRSRLASLLSPPSAAAHVPRERPSGRTAACASIRTESSAIARTQHLCQTSQLTTRAPQQPLRRMHLPPPPPLVQPQTRSIQQNVIQRRGGDGHKRNRQKNTYSSTAPSPLAIQHRADAQGGGQAVASLVAVFFGNHVQAQGPPRRANQRYRHRTSCNARSPHAAARCGLGEGLGPSPPVASAAQHGPRRGGFIIGPSRTTEGFAEGLHSPKSTRHQQTPPSGRRLQQTPEPSKRAKHLRRCHHLGEAADSTVHTA